MRDKIIFTIAKVIALLLLIAISCATTYAVMIDKKENDIVDNSSEVVSYVVISLQYNLNTCVEVRVIKDSYFSPPSKSELHYRLGTFKGWFRDLEYTVPWIVGEDKATVDLSLYAKWESVF